MVREIRDKNNDDIHAKVLLYYPKFVCDAINLIKAAVDLRRKNVIVNTECVLIRAYAEHTVELAREDKTIFGGIEMYIDESVGHFRINMKWD